MVGRAPGKEGGWGFQALIKQQAHFKGIWWEEKGMWTLRCLSSWSLPGLQSQEQSRQGEETAQMETRCI